MTRKPDTALDDQIVLLISDLMAERGYPATRRELAVPLGRSTSVIEYHLRELYRVGLVLFEREQSRTLRLTSKGRERAMHLRHADSGVAGSVFDWRRGSEPAKLICARCGGEFWNGSQGNLMYCAGCTDQMRG